MTLRAAARIPSSVAVCSAAVVISAIALALSFPPHGFWCAAYFFAAPLIYASRKFGPRAGVLCALASGTLGYGAILYWIFPTVAEHTGSSPQAAASIVLISLYPSIYLAAFAALCGGFRTLRGKIFDGAADIVMPAAAWVSLEYLRSFLFTGFPWGIVGYSQWNFIPALWSARYAGVFGVSFAVMLANILSADLALRNFRRAHKAAAVFLACYFAAGAYFSVLGQKKHSAPAENTAAITAAVIQPSVDQEKKWDGAYFAETKAKLSALVSAASGSGADFVLWPETSLTETVAPGSVPAWMRSLAAESGVPQIVGTLYAEDSKIYNAAVVINPGGEIKSVHKKTHLVPFGEFVPARKWLEPHFGVFNFIGDLEKSRGHTVFDINGKKIAAVICSENLYGDITRRFAAAGAEALFVITNDAWYGSTAAAFQHFTFNVLRAAETGRWVVQSGNTGISGVVSPDGRVKAATGLLEATWFAAEIPLLSSPTFYARFGDLFAIICVFFTAAFLAAAMAAGRKKS